MSWACMNALIDSNAWTASVKLGFIVITAVIILPLLHATSTSHHTTHFFHTHHTTHHELLVHRHMGVKVQASGASPSQTQSSSCVTSSSQLPLTCVTSDMSWFFFTWPHFTKEFWIVVTCYHAETIKWMARPVSRHPPFPSSSLSGR
jgi:hypothetical protein